MAVGGIAIKSSIFHIPSLSSLESDSCTNVTAKSITSNHKDQILDGGWLGVCAGGEKKEIKGQHIYLFYSDTSLTNDKIIAERPLPKIRTERTKTKI